MKEHMMKKGQSLQERSREGEGERRFVGVLAANHHPSSSHHRPELRRSDLLVPSLHPMTLHRTNEQQRRNLGQRGMEVLRRCTREHDGQPDDKFNSKMNVFILERLPKERIIQTLELNYSVRDQQRRKIDLDCNSRIMALREKLRALIESNQRTNLRDNLRQSRLSP